MYLLVEGSLISFKWKRVSPISIKVFFTNSSGEEGQLISQFYKQRTNKYIYSGWLFTFLKASVIRV